MQDKNSILNILEGIKENIKKDITNEKNLDVKSLKEIKIKYVGKNSKLSKILKEIKKLPNEDKAIVGKLVNDLNKEINSLINDKLIFIEKENLQKSLEKEKIDVSLSYKKHKKGYKHPISIITNNIIDIFVGLGYEVCDGPEIEYDKYNFQLLNIEEGHPARDLQDTFYINDHILLRTHTSSIQARIMQKHKLPIQVICPGRVYRNDEIDSIHSPIFNQIEGLVINKNVSFANLKYTLEIFAKELFGESIKTRFRPHHFPFTEPSAEMDVSCFKCKGKGCSFCKQEGWIEILGCGMVHPKVLELNNIDSNEYSGFAFGLGIDRITLLKYEIDDIRLLYKNNINFLKQF